MWRCRRSRGKRRRGERERRGGPHPPLDVCCCLSRSMTTSKPSRNAPARAVSRASEGARERGSEGASERASERARSSERGSERALHAAPHRQQRRRRSPSLPIANNTTPDDRFEAPSAQQIRARTTADSSREPPPERRGERCERAPPSPPKDLRWASLTFSSAKHQPLPHNDTTARGQRTKPNQQPPSPFSLREEEEGTQ